jgi:hypothetical protein
MNNYPSRNKFIVELEGGEQIVLDSLFESGNLGSATLDEVDKNQASIKSILCFLLAVAKAEN